MITVRAGSAAIGLCLMLLTAGCSREQQDWRSAEAADTIDSYSQFIQRHPESELVTQARTRVAQLGEDRDWQRAGSADTVDAYREFIAQHPSGKWAQEANIRIQNFSLGEQTGTDAATKAAGPAGAVGTAPRAVSPGSSAANASAGAGLAVGGPRAVPALPAPTSAASATPASAPPIATAAAARPVAAATQGASSAVSFPSPSQGARTAASPPSRGARAAGSPPSPSQGADATGSPTSPSQGAGARSYGLAQPGDAATPAGSASPRIASASTGAAVAANPAGGGAAAAPQTRAHSPGGGSPSNAKTGFGIQLGAFSSEASASAQWGTLSSRYAPQLQGLRQHVVAADTASGRVYRLQAIVGDEGRARAICDQLRQHGQACVAVLPH